MTETSIEDHLSHRPLERVNSRLIQLTFILGSSFYIFWITSLFSSSLLLFFKQPTPPFSIFGGAGACLAFTWFSCFFYFPRNKAKYFVVILLLQLLFSSFSFWASQLSFDLTPGASQYFQEELIQLRSGWTPTFSELFIGEQSKDFSRLIELYAAPLFQLTGNLNFGKSLNFLSLFGTFFLSLSALLQFRFIPASMSSIISLLIAVNPITLNELYNYRFNGIIAQLISSLLAVATLLYFKFDKFRLFFLIIIATMNVALFSESLIKPTSRTADLPSGNRIEQFFLNTFSTANHSIKTTEDTKLKLPFTYSSEEILEYKYGGTPIAGYGPLFSGSLCIGLLILMISFFIERRHTLITALLFSFVLATVLLTPNSQYAKLVPQGWLLALIPIVLAVYLLFKDSRSNLKLLISNRILAGLTAFSIISASLNLWLIASSYLPYQLNLSRSQDLQLFQMSVQKVPVQVYFNHLQLHQFRLQKSGVLFREVASAHHLTCRQPKQLISSNLTYCFAGDF